MRGIPDAGSFSIRGPESGGERLVELVRVRNLDDDAAVGLGRFELVDPEQVDANVLQFHDGIGLERSWRKVRSNPRASSKGMVSSRVRHGRSGMVTEPTAKKSPSSRVPDYVQCQRLVDHPVETQSPPRRSLCRYSARSEPSAYLWTAPQMEPHVACFRIGDRPGIPSDTSQTFPGRRLEG
jgi:hypothetical protein